MNTRGFDSAGVAIAVALALLAGVTVFNASTLAAPSFYGLGPKAMPWLVGSGLALLSIGTLVGAWRGDLPEREPADWGPIVLILGGFGALIAIIWLGGGFTLASTVVFAATARAFGRRALLTDALIGAVLGLVTYLFFTKLLTLSLPQGPLERLF